MARAQGIFLSIVVLFGFLNVITWLLGLTINWLNVTTLLANLLLLAGIGVLIAVLSLLGSPGYFLKWLMPSLFFACILFAIDWSVAGYPIHIGIGLVSNIANLFDSNINNPTFILYWGCQFIGIIGLICGLLITSGGGD